MSNKQIEDDTLRHSPPILRLPRDSLDNAKTRRRFRQAKRLVDVTESDDDDEDTTRPNLDALRR